MRAVCLYLVIYVLLLPTSTVFFFLMIRRPPRSTLDRSSAASDVYKRQLEKDAYLATANTETMIIPLLETRDAVHQFDSLLDCLLYTSPSPRDRTRSRMPSSA